MATSSVTICNLALRRLGANRITSLSEGTTNANLCNDMYSLTVDEVLRMHPWNCALYRKTLSALEDAPEFGFDYQYTLPTSPYCLKALRINEDPNDIFKVEGRVLLTDHSEVDLEYIKRITDPAEFDALLITVIATRLAMHLAIPVTHSGTLRDRIEKEFWDTLREARFADAQEGTPDEIDTSTWLDSRY